MFEGKTVSDKLPPRILVIESDEALSSSICNAIERSWFDVARATDEETAIAFASSNLPNVAIISSRIKDISPVAMSSKLRKLNKATDLPIIFLLDAGQSFENYNSPNNDLVEVIYRPFTPNQLMISIKSLLRKSQPIFQNKIIKYKDVSMDLATYKVIRRNKSIHLGPTEFKILHLFVQSPKVIFSRQQIIDYVWGTGKEIEHRTVDVHVNRLRTLMKVEDKDEQFIKTVRANGYCLNLPSEID